MKKQTLRLLLNIIAMVIVLVTFEYFLTDGEVFNFKCYSFYAWFLQIGLLSFIVGLAWLEGKDYGLNADNKEQEL